MSDIKFIKKPLNDIFEVGRGSPKYTQSYANKNKGSYPVYSSKTENEGLFATINTYDYDGEYLTWSTDGYAGVLFHRVGKFSCTDHCGILSLRKNVTGIYLPYVQKVLDFRSLAIGNGNMRVKTNMVKRANPMIPFPLDENGKYDYQEQIAIAKRYENLENKRAILNEYKLTLQSSLISENFAEKYKHTDVDLTALFTPKRGNSKYTKTYCFNNRGDYPIYSANNNDPLAYSNFYDYDGEYLTISVNGIAGKITLKDGKFSINADRVILVPIAKNVDLDYIKYTVEPILRSKIKGRRGHDGQNEFTKLPGGTIENVKISIPVDENGNYDLDAQKEISKKYQKIQNIIDSICKQIDDLTSIKISI